MKEKHRERVESKEVCYRELEEFARGKIREHLQDLLEQEVTEGLGRGKSERRGNRKEQPGYRNGYGKKRRVTLSSWTIEFRRPRVRNHDERCISQVLMLLTRQPAE